MKPHTAKEIALNLQPGPTVCSTLTQRSRIPRLSTPKCLGTEEPKRQGNQEGRTQRPRWHTSGQKLEEKQINFSNPQAGVGGFPGGLFRKGNRDGSKLVAS